MNSEKTNKLKELLKLSSHKHQIEETMQQFNDLYCKKTNILYKVAEEKENNYVENLKKKLKIMKEEFKNLKKEKNETLLIQQLEKQKNEILKERNLILQNTFNKSLLIQKKKEEMKDLKMKNENLDRELEFLNEELKKAEINSNIINHELISLNSQKSKAFTCDLFQLIENASFLKKNKFKNIFNNFESKKHNSKKLKPVDTKNMKYNNIKTTINNQNFDIKDFPIFIIEDVLNNIIKNHFNKDINLFHLKPYEKINLVSFLLNDPDFKKYIYEKITFDFSK